MKHNPFYSVIVPSFNRKEEIRELLDSFKYLQFPPEKYELIIADDGSTDGTETLVKEYQQNCDFILHFCRQENRGPSAARNMGMDNAKGDFFIFIDSDCTVSPKWLKAIDETLQLVQADAFGGPDSQRDDFPPLLKAINYSMTSFITTGGIRGHKKKRLGKYYPRTFNMGISLKVYKKIGGFSDLPHGEDIEFSHRVIQSGAKVILIPDAIVYHKRRTSVKKFFRQVFIFGAARFNLYKLDHRMLEVIHVLPALITLSLVLLGIGSLVSPAVWNVFKWLLILGILVLITSGIHAAIRYRNLRLLYLVPILMPIQIIGYGSGFISAFFARIIFKKDEFTGSGKKHY